MKRSNPRGAASLLALALASAPGAVAAQEQPPAGTAANVAEPASDDIIVTAQKREERLQDVPVPVTAITSSTLVNQNQVRAQDFFSSVPGLNLQFQNSRSNLAIRGVTTGPATGNPVVGYTIDDIPYGSSVGLAGLFGSAPDIDPSELARIEVLRGPQGTLYGAASIGGLVKYVTVDPSTEGVSGAVAAGVSVIRGAEGEAGYNVRGAVNLPVTDTLAVRASAFTRTEPGYIDNVVTGRRGVNRSEVAGGRLSAMWRPASGVSIKLGALYQDRRILGTNDVDTRLGSRYLQTNQFNTGRSNSTNQLYSAIVNVALGASQLTSLTSYSYNKNNDTVDFSASALTAALPSIYPVGINPMATVLNQFYSTRKFTQELRLAMPVGERIDWIVGAFYTRENTRYTIRTDATDPANGTIYGYPIVWPLDRLRFTEYAAFTDVTVRLSERFDVQVGGRYSENRQTLQHQQFTFFDPPEGVASNPSSRGSAFTYLVTPRFRITHDHMVYGRVASGYRPGGPNALCNDVEIPCQYKPDKTVNYEIGAKGNVLDRALSYDLSVYYIDWKDLQVTQVVPAGTNNYNANASRARSRGAEASFEARPARGLTLTLWGAYTDAVLREGFSALVAVYGARGDRLPYSSRWSGRSGANQEWPIDEDTTAILGGSVSYIGDRRGEFVSTAAEAPLRQFYPAYAQGDLYLGARWRGWRATIFVRNVTNSRGVTGGGYNNQTEFNRFWLNYTQPRTAGMTLEKSF